MHFPPYHGTRTNPLATKPGTSCAGLVFCAAIAAGCSASDGAPSPAPSGNRPTSNQPDARIGASSGADGASVTSATTGSAPSSPASPIDETPIDAPQPSGSSGAPQPADPSALGAQVGFADPDQLGDGATYVEIPAWQPPPFTGSGCDGERGVWGETLQKALWFLDVNRSGPGITHTLAQWRGDSHLEDGHILLEAGVPNGVDMSQEYIDTWRGVLDPKDDGELDMAGGFYDAGDFLKIGITSNYMAHTLAWMMWEFPEAFAQTGMKPEALRVLRWYADFALKNTYVENPGDPDPWKWNVVAYGHQVAGSSDHDCGWMPPELRRASTCPRMGHFATHESPLADVTAGAAAALALIGWHFRDVDPDYATRCLNHAIALYEFAKRYPGTTWPAEGLYQSEGSYDDLAWAAIWLHEVLPASGQPGATEQTNLYASHKESYLADLVTEGASWLEHFRGSGPKISCIEQGGNCWAESWTHIWNSLRSGVFVKLAEILPRYGNRFAALSRGMLDIARDDSLAWVVGPHTAGGFAKKVDVSWGSGRYNAAGQMVSLVFARRFPDDVVPDSGAYASLAGQRTSTVLAEWARGQSEYLLGDNPLGMSYMMGHTDDFASSAHHAATHASIYGLCQTPEASKHIAYGALVSGPNQGDDHSDDRCDYGANEITIDYNAALIGALAGNYAFWGQGQCPDPAFPPVEAPFQEFYTQARINDTWNCNQQVEVTLVNETAHPPRFDTTLKVRFFVDVSEYVENGMDASALDAKIIYDNYGEEPAISSPMQDCALDSATKYFEISYPYEFWGAQVWLKGPRTFIIELGMQDNPGCVFDEDNDFSSSQLTGEVALSPTVPAYSEGRLVWGMEPECNEPPKIAVPPPVIR